MRDHLRADPGSVLVIINEDYISPKDFRRAMQASGDDATIVVGRPVAEPVRQGTATTTGGVPSTVVPPPTPPMPTPETASSVA